MSTNDVPGAVKRNHDDLHQECWAEADDGSLLRIEGITRGKVYFTLYDPKDPGFKYVTGMVEDEFKRHFSFDPKKTGSLAIKWTWHDKTPWPFERVIDMGIKEGHQRVFAADVITNGKQVADHLKAKKIPVDQDAMRMKHSHMVEKETKAHPTWVEIGVSIFGKLRRAKQGEVRR